MQRDEQHVGTLIENVLRAVPMVEIDVDDGNPPGATVKQALCRDGGVVEKTVAAKHVPGRVMSRRAAQREGAARPAAHQLGSRERHLRAGMGGLPCALGDACLTGQ